MPENAPNGWGEWSRHVLLELERLNALIEEALKKIGDNKNDLTIVKTKQDAVDCACAQNKAESAKALELAQENSRKIASHKLIAVAISSVSSIIVALITTIAMSH